MKHTAIQAILIVVILLTLLYAIRKRSSTRFEASEKILFLIFVIVSVMAVIEPNALTRIAKLVGVGRGADLLLYLLILAFIFVVLNIYLKFKELEQKITELARRIALNEAVESDQRKADLLVN